MIRIAIAEDQSIFRNGLMRLLNDIEDFNVVLSVENGQELLDSLKTVQVDVVLIDYRMPVKNGIETTHEIRKTKIDLKILLLSLYDNPEFVELAIEKGANGYLSKDDDSEEIFTAIRSVHETGYYLNERTSKMFISKLMNKGQIKPEFKIDSNQVSFSEIELQVLELICKEYTTQEISDKLFRSPRTIDTIRSGMLQKIGARNVVGLVMYALKYNLCES